MICNHCGSQFESIKTNKKYCHKKCYAAAKARRHYQKVGKNKYTIICANCEKESQTDSPKRKYCSRKCASEGSRKFLSIPECLEDASRKLDKAIGYVRVYCPMHPKANTWGYVYEHRLIAESMISRYLKEDEVVHHKNGKRWDNRPENLEVMDKREHSSLCGQREEDLEI